VCGRTYEPSKSVNVDHAAVPHARLLTAGMIRTLSRVDRRSLDAGLVGYRGHGAQEEG